MSVSKYPFNLRIVLVLFLELLRISNAFLLSRQKWFQRVSGICFPNSNIGVFRTWENVAIVHRIDNGVDLLHSLGVVYLSWPSLVERKDSDSFVETWCHEFSARGSKINIKNGRNVILVYHLGLLGFSKVKSVAIGILVSDNEVHWFLWIPTKRWTFILQVNLVDWCISSDVVEADASIHGHTGNQVYLRWIELQFGDGVNSPLKGLKRCGPLIIPDLHSWTSGGKNVLRVRVIDSSKKCFTDICSSWFVVSESHVLETTLISRYELLILWLELVNRPQIYFLVITSWREYRVCRNSTIICESNSSDEHFMCVNLKKRLPLWDVPEDDFSISTSRYHLS